MRRLRLPHQSPRRSNGEIDLMFPGSVGALAVAGGPSANREFQALRDALRSWAQRHHGERLGAEVAKQEPVRLDVVEVGLMGCLRDAKQESQSTNTVRGVPPRKRRLRRDSLSITKHTSEAL